MDEPIPPEPVTNPTGADPIGKPAPPQRLSFFDDFRRFFISRLAAILPTIITLGLMVWIWDFLWNNVGSHIIWFIRWSWLTLCNLKLVGYRSNSMIYQTLPDESFWVRAMGVGLAVVFIYFVGVVVGNLLGRTLWRLAEFAVMRIPLIRAIYPAVKQVTDFLLSERSAQFQGSKVVAVEPHEKGIWSIGLVTGNGLIPLTQATGRDMITVFVPSSPTAFSGYVLVVPRESVIELPMKVEEVMRLLVSGGVISPESDRLLAESMRFPGAKSSAAPVVRQPPAA